MQSLVDRIIGEIDHALRVVAAPAAPAAAPTAKDEAADQALSDQERDESAALMRVNHAGEIAAQALYRGQAAVSRDPELRSALLSAADDEHRHLVWCEQRVAQLGSHTSRLAPIWYAGAFAMGGLAGLAGDRISLGFLAETEKQVARHLAGHLERLPVADRPSRDIVERMQSEEIAHGEEAIQRGGAELPEPVPSLMAATARVMTTLAHRF
jgi:ubiquinone biosynthesis monooxygenase Coq7